MSQITQDTQLINNQWQHGLGHAFNSVNPSNGDIVWQGKTATAEQVDAAIKAAREAQLDWADKTVDERIAVLERFADQ